MKTNTICSTIFLLIFISCNNSKKYTSLPEGLKFIDAIHIDSSISPADDFYTYAGGAWMKNTKIPDDESRWSSFNVLRDFNRDAMKELTIKAAAKPGSEGSPKQMVGDLYASGMDTETIEAEGIGPLKEIFAKIDSIKDLNSFIDVLVELNKEGANPLFHFYVSPDEKNVSKYQGSLWQGGLSLPDRDYYLKADKAEIRKDYETHLQKMFTLAKIKDPSAKSKAVLSIEKNLAQSSMARVEMRDPYKTYNKHSVADLSKQTPGINWTSFLKRIGAAKADTLIVGQPKFLKSLASMMTTRSIDDWKAYLKWHILSDASPYLSSDFDNEHFEFYGKTLKGQEEQKERWKRVLGVVDGAVGHQLGKLYVEKYFTQEAKDRMQALVDNLQVTFGERIEKLDWMSDETKEKAMAKLNSFTKKIGYPDNWRSYDGLSISRDSYFDNIRASNKFDFEYTLAKLGKEVDKTEWGMTPPTVNAYYNPSFNEIVFPAGILQYPFFSMEADDAAVYGAIGGVIGHEMTHGFDDQGSQYAADGNLKDWWTAEDKKLFQAKTKMVEQQFDNLTILDDKHVNGSLTLGENIADLGGVTIAYAAYKKTKQGQSGEKIDGFTGDQRFFLSWAQVWRQNIRDEEAAQRLITDPHSPGIHRCNGPLSNFAPFYTAFNVKEGDKMWKPEEKRAVIW